MMHAILFVCTANICRSPMAEGAFLAMLRQAGSGETPRVASVGTHDYHVGRPAFPAAVSAARKRGYDIASHVARRVTPADLERYDLILAMDRSNIAALRTIAPTRCKEKIELLLDYGDEYHGSDVPDPYGGTTRDFDRALDMIEDGCRGLLQLIVR